jgi:hypothetical protein
MFTIGIPTMWRSDMFLTMIKKYIDSDMIVQIVIVDNDIKLTPKIPKSDKILYLPQERNVFVNPAWNLIASYAKFDLILANDDIYIENLDECLELIKKSPYEITGACINSSEKKIEPLDVFPAMSWGCFMYIKKYLYIPEQLKIFMGDRFLFDKLTHGRICGFIETKRSETVKSLGVGQEIFKEGKIYNKMMIPSKTNIIIRTSNRPNYFHNAIKSAKKNFPNAKMHVTVDDKKDLVYVLKECPDCNYYLIDRDKIQRFADKYKIERKPFIYNLYLDVVRPFLSGWCMILDDDCEIMSRPQIPHNTKSICISKVDIRSRIVPEQWKKEPRFSDIDMGGILFHSSQMVGFTPQRGGDFQFIKEMYDKSNVNWNNQLVVRMQTGLNRGQRNDLPNPKKDSETLNPYNPDIDNLIYPCNISWQFESSIEKKCYLCEDELLKDVEFLKHMYK